MSHQQLTPDSVPKADGMPMLGLGTWQNEDADSITTALEVGFRHIDTAQAYGNERAVGEGIAQADVDRDDVFLATKVWPSNLAYEDVLESTASSMEKLGVDYLDLLYVHWPADRYDVNETLAAFDELVDEGRIRNVGVSNFQPAHVTDAIAELDAPVFANQVECHPLLPQTELRGYCENADVNVVAYSPLARGKVFDVDEMQDVAEKHGVSEAQVSLAWLREKGVTAIPKASGEDHIRDNWESLGVELDDEDVETIDAIDERDRQVDPSFAPW